MITTDTLTVGQTVHADLGSTDGWGGRTIVATGEVINISPTGVARVKFATLTKSFNSSGLERGADWRNRVKLIDKATYDRLRPIMLAERRQSRAYEAIQFAAQLPCNADNKADIINRLNAAINAVEAM